MALEDLPLFIGGLALLVQDLRWNPQLPDVVDERRPVQLLPVCRGEVHLLGDEVGVASHSLGMAAGLAVVGGEPGYQGQEGLSGFVRCRGGGAVLDLVELALQLAGRPGLERSFEPVRCMVGKGERHPKQHCHGQESASRVVEHAHRDHHRRDRARPPGDGREQPCGSRDDGPIDVGGGQRTQQGGGEHESADGERQRRARGPASVVKICCLTRSRTTVGSSRNTFHAHCASLCSIRCRCPCTLCGRNFGAKCAMLNTQSGWTPRKWCVRPIYPSRAGVDGAG